MTAFLAEGDALVLYSDGVTEAIVDGEELGVAGLKRMSRRRASARELVERGHERRRHAVTVRA